MGGEIDDLSRAEAASLLGWWLEAGVDVADQREPRDWLKPGAAPIAADRSRRLPQRNCPTRSRRSSDWLASSARLPLDRPAARRILPHGPAEAAVMLISRIARRARMPATASRSAATAWQLMERMLAAIGIERRRGLQRLLVLLPCCPARG